MNLLINAWQNLLFNFMQNHSVLSWHTKMWRVPGRLLARVAPAALLALLISTPLALAETEELLSFANAEQQLLYRELTAELRCPKCQNQNIADSHAVVAVDMRQKTYQLLQQGQNKAQIIAYMKTRYGDFVHYQPPLQLSTIWLWLAPLLLIVGLAGMILKKVRDPVTADPASSTTAAEDAPELQAMIDEVKGDH